MAVSEVDDRKLMSIFSKNSFKLYRELTMDSRKSSSLPSSPASSAVSTPRETSDDNSSTSSATSLLPSSVSRHVQAKQRKRKRKNIDSNTKSEETFAHWKQPRTETRDSIVAAYTRYFENSRLGSTVHVGDEKTKPQVPSAWHGANSSHSIFTNGSQKKDNNSCRNSPSEAFSPSKRRGKSQLWQKPDWTNRKGHGSPETSSDKSWSSCLISCKSCRDYTLPDLSEEEMSEMSCYLALDCEFVGVGPNKKDALGRCSIVDHQGRVVFDRFVKPPEQVTDYRTPWSGLRPRHLRCGIPFVVAQEMIAAIIKDKVVIGHAVHNDFRVLGLKHPGHLIRDTAGCKLLREMASLPNNACALRKLSSVLLGRAIQKKEHCSVTDSRTCLDLFRLVRAQWEPVLKAKLQRRAARQSENSEEKVTDSVKDSEAELELNSFFDDKYWPDHAFQDDHA